MAKAYGPPIAKRTDKITKEDIGTGAGLFEVRKTGDEYVTSSEQCKDPKPAPSSCGAPAKTF